MVRHYLSHWTLGILDGDVDADRVAQALAADGAGPVRVRAGIDPDRALIVFREADSDSVRGMHCLGDAAGRSEIGQVSEARGTYLRLGDYGTGREVVRSIVARYGGWFLASDRGGFDWERVPAPSDGDAPSTPGP
jgi:hypothetical protein